MMDKILKKQTERNIEAYVDDMVVKTKCGNSHLEDLKEIFATLSEYDLKLNPNKCTFEVKSRMFMGFMTTKRRIEAITHKVDALIRVAEPRCIKDIQCLNICMAALGRFISKSANKCMSFFMSPEAAR